MFAFPLSGPPPFAPSQPDFSPSQCDYPSVPSLFCSDLLPTDTSSTSSASKEAAAFFKEGGTAVPSYSSKSIRHHACAHASCVIPSNSEQSTTSQFAFESIPSLASAQATSSSIADPCPLKYLGFLVVLGIVACEHPLVSSCALVAILTSQ
jgi:hypothetical protein